jgi:hypothetical protein
VAPPWVVSPDQWGPDSRVDTTAARAPQRGGLSMGGGSPYGYRRWVREIPSLVIAMRESNAPSPPVSQSAAITPSAKEQPLTAYPTDSRVCNTGCLHLSRGIFVGWWMLAGRGLTIRGGTKLRRRQRWGAKRAASGPAIRPGRPWQAPAMRRNVTCNETGNSATAWLLPRLISAPAQFHASAGVTSVTWNL